MGESVRVSWLFQISVGLLIIGVISQVSTYPSVIVQKNYDQNNWESSQLKVKRDTEGEGVPPDPNIEVIEKLAVNLKPEWLMDDDAMVQQKLDRINDISKYLDPEDNTTIIFERQKLDSNKEIVVLTGSEDRRQFNGSHKRTYIVLKKFQNIPTVGNEKPPTYYFLFHAYIRDAREADNATEVVSVNGSQVTVEWDIFEDRVPSKTFHSGWSNCAYTMLFSCGINETALEDAMEEIGKPSNKEEVSTTEKSTAVQEKQPIVTPLEPIVTEKGYDAEEYIDFYGEFDVNTDVEKSGRSLFGGLTSFFGSKETRRKKVIKIVKTTSASSSSQSTTQQSSSSYMSGLMSYLPSSVSSIFSSWGSSSGQQNSQISNADAVYGIYYQGIPGTPQIFLPDGQETPVLFVPDGTTSTYTVHGIYAPGTVGYPDVFTADDATSTQGIYNTQGTMIPDGMTMSGITGGIHGVLSGESFRPDVLGNAMWFNPDGPEAQGVWTSFVKSKNTTERPKTTNDGTLIVYGVEFPGVSGSPDVFIPDGSGIPGYFVPNDPAHPEVIAIPHGSFVATKPAGHGTFYPDTFKDVQKVEQVRGAFMPDGMNLSGAIAGLITKDVGNSFVFVVDVPGLEFDYYKGKPDTNMANIWTPFLKPGEFKPPTTTPAPLVSPAGQAPPGSGNVATTTSKPGHHHGGPPAKKKHVNPSFMYGIRFPGMGSLDIFIPDDQPVPGLLIPEDPKYNQIQGTLVGVGKQGEKATFVPQSPETLASLPTLQAVFVPDGIAPGNGIIGEMTLNAQKTNSTWRSDPPSKGYWFIKGKPENTATWTPMTPPVSPVTKKPTLVEKVLSQPFLAGFYIPGIPGTEPTFIPDEGALGCFYPDVTTLPKSCGTYYPEKPDAPAEFIQTVANSLKNNTPGVFIPDLNNGSTSGNRFHATFVIKPPETFVPDSPPYKGWSQSTVKVSTIKRTIKTTTTTTSSTNTTTTEHSTYIPIAVGGGFSGYPTNGKGIDALVDPNSPIFKEFIQWKARKDKSINPEDKIVIVNNLQEIDNYKSSNNVTQSSSNVKNQASGGGSGAINGVSFINLDEYRSYVDERYSIKTTTIKTSEMNEVLELAVPKAAEKYVKKKGKLKLNLVIGTSANAAANGGAGSGGMGAGSGASSVSIKGFSGGKECETPWSSTAQAIAKAQNGSTATSEANAINGGNANAVSLAKDGSTSTSNANVKDGGTSNAQAQAKSGANSTATANALHGAVANAIAQNKENKSGAAEANAKRTGNKTFAGCGNGAEGLPDEIEIDSHAVANALNNGTGAGSVSSSATANVKISMAGLAAKIAELQAKRDAQNIEEDETIEIHINSAATSTGSTGRSFGDSEDDAPKKRTKLGRNMAQGTASSSGGKKLRTGWKTEFKVIAPNVTLLHEGIVFYGLGSCPYNGDIPTNNLKDLKSEELIDFYMKILRVDCTEKVKLRVMGLFNTDYLEFSEYSEYLQIPPENQFLNQPKIYDYDLRYLSIAFEIFVFTKTYKEQLEAAGKTEVAVYMTEEVGTKATRSVRFLTEFALNYVEECRKIALHHYIRLTRHLLTTLRTVMIKLYQDGELLKTCKECTYDHQMNRHDQIHIMGVLQFIVHGLAPYEKGHVKNIRTALKEFLLLNRKKLESRVNEYDNQFPK